MKFVAATPFSRRDFTNVSTPRSAEFTFVVAGVRCLRLAVVTRVVDDELHVGVLTSGGTDVAGEAHALVEAGKREALVRGDDLRDPVLVSDLRDLFAERIADRIVEEPPRRVRNVAPRGVDLPAADLVAVTARRSAASGRTLPS